VKVKKRRAEKKVKQKYLFSKSDKPKYASNIDVFEYLAKKIDRFSPVYPYPAANGILSIPKIFSLAEEPEDSFYFLKCLFFNLKNPLTEDIFLNYENCIRIDLDASVLMDVILKEFIRKIEKERYHINYSNKVKIKSISALNLERENIKRFSYAIGAHKNIRNIDVTYPDIITFDLHTSSKGMGSGYKEIESTHLVDHINKCLAKLGKKLTQESKENFADIFGEVIANAEEHSSTDTRYSIGYYELCETECNEHVGTFQFVIFNFGESFYEHLCNENAIKNKKIIDDMKNLSKRYTSRGLLGLLPGEIPEETLWTLYALQDGVSCINQERGNGTIRFIESFLELRGDNIGDTSKMVLLTGNTRILFDGVYSTKNKTGNDGENYKIITFNEASSIDEKPDDKYVTFAKNYFPGTIIYANITIKEENLKNNGNSIN
jgi:hypothetical protein